MYVSLGQTFETSHDMYMEKPQPGTHSTHALSEIVPDPSMSIELADKSPPFTARKGSGTVVVPLGMPVPSN